MNGMTNSPIIAIEYMLGDQHYFYHTDGNTLLGPNHPLRPANEVLKNLPHALMVSYLVMVDPGNPSKIYYRNIVVQRFESEGHMKEGITEFILEFKEAYAMFNSTFPFDKYSGQLYTHYKFEYPNLVELKVV